MAQSHLKITSKAFWKSNQSKTLLAGGTRDLYPFQKKGHASGLEIKNPENCLWLKIALEDFLKRFRILFFCKPLARPFF